MNWLLLGIVILAWRTLWGLGLSCLLLPPRMRRYALVFAPLAGAALQMVVVWVGAHLDWTGTVTYAWWSCLLPLGLLCEAGRRSGLKWFKDIPTQLLCWGGVVAVMGMALGATGCAPPFSKGWQARPPCQSCRKIRPPLACTAAVIFFQASTCAGDQMPGVSA